MTSNFIELCSARWSATPLQHPALWPAHFYNKKRKWCAELSATDRVGKLKSSARCGCITGFGLFDGFANGQKLYDKAGMPLKGTEGSTEKLWVATQRWGQDGPKQQTGFLFSSNFHTCPWPHCWHKSSHLLLINANIYNIFLYLRQFICVWLFCFYTYLFILNLPTIDNTLVGQE